MSLPLSARTSLRMRSTVAAGLGLAAVSALAGAVRLGAVGLWRDEAFSARLASLPPGTFLRFVAGVEPNGLLYHLVLFGWVRLGQGEAFLRIPSVLFAAGSVVLTYLLGKRLLGRPAGILGALLLACNPIFLAYSQEVRSYALMVLVATAGSLIFTAAVLDDDRRAWRWYPVVAALSMYAHYFAALTIAAQFISLLLLGRRRVEWSRVVRSGAVLAVLVSPLLLFGLSNRPDSLSGVLPTTPGRLLTFTLGLVGGKELTVVLLGLVATSIGFWLRGAGTVAEGRQRWTMGFLVTSLVVPLATGLVVSLFKPLMVPRYFLAVLPPLMLLAAAGALHLHRRLLRGRAAPGMVVLLLPLLGFSVSQHYLTATKPDSRGAVGHVTSHAQPGDAIAFPTFWGIPAFQWYGVRIHPQVAELLDFVFPRPQRRALLGDDLWRDGDFLVRSTAQSFDPQPARAAIGEHRRLWTIEDGGGDERSRFEEQILLDMIGGKRLCEERHFRDVHVRLYAVTCPQG